MTLRSIIGLVAVALLIGAAVIAFAFSVRPDSARILTLPRTDAPYPAEILDLQTWKVTLPVSAESEFTTPLEIRQPELASYRLDPWFMPTRDRKGVVFRAPVNAPTTGNTSYPRSELREMTADGSKVVYWSSKEGTHMLILDQAITAVPDGKPDVVAGQIHGDDDDLLVVRLEYPKLFIARGKKNVYTIDEQYTLGKRFAVRFVVKDGVISAYANGSATPVYSFEKAIDEAYFKVGIYTQSNCETEGTPELCSADNFGETVIYQATVTHEP
jgi:hypothetical protein